MSVVIVPGQFRGEPAPVGKLATTLLSVTVAGMADPARFRRGKGYVTDHAVTRLEVSPGTLTASVLGSRPDPYHVVVTVRTIERPESLATDGLRAHVSRLTPEAGDLMLSCTCPDWDDPCKHGVAALLAFAGELGARPELLAEWRCNAIDGESVIPRARAGSRARADRHLRLAPPPPAAPPWTTDEWHAFEGSLPLPALPPVPDEPATVGPARIGTIDLGRLVQSALETLTWQG